MHALQLDWLSSTGSSSGNFPLLLSCWINFQNVAYLIKHKGKVIFNCPDYIKTNPTWEDSDCLKKGYVKEPNGPVDGNKGYHLQWVL